MDGDELVTRRSGRSVTHSFAPQPEDATGAGTFRDRQLHSARDGGHLDLGTEHRLVDRDRQVESDVVADALELRMRAHLDLDQRIAWLAAVEAGAALALEPQNLPVLHALGHSEIQHATAGHRHAFARALNCLQEVDLQGVADVAAADADAKSLPPRATGTAKYLREDVGESEVFERGSPSSSSAPPTEWPGASRALVLILVSAPGLARGIDLAAIITPALLGIA